MTGAERPDVSAIVVCWNTRHLLDACLASLRDHGPTSGRMELIVVDNGSTDGTVDHVRRHWPEVEVIANVDNAGYTRANNQGIARARADRLLLINDDARLAPGCLDAMLAIFDRDPRAAVVGPRLLYGDGRFQRWTAGREPSLGSAASFFLGLERLPRGPRGLYLGRDVGEPFQPDWVTSACMLVRRGALDEVGLLDESLFVYMDDVDLCRRVRAAGWHVWYEPRAEAVHLMGQSDRRLTGNISGTSVRSLNRYFRRRRGPLALALLRAVEAIGFGGRAALYLVADRLRPRPWLRDRARAHWVYFKRALEPLDA